ncbi:MAG: hypothetical protein QXN05_05260 [Acidilobaceae archaeon]
MSGEREEKREPDKSKILHMLSRIPSPSALKEQEKTVRERRLRIAYDNSVKPGHAKIRPSLAASLKIEEFLEIVATGKDPLVLKALIDDTIEETKVHVNPEEMKSHGIADNSVVTLRAAKRT